MQLDHASVSESAALDDGLCDEEPAAKRRRIAAPQDQDQDQDRSDRVDETGPVIHQLVPSDTFVHSPVDHSSATHGEVTLAPAPAQLAVEASGLALASPVHAPVPFEPHIEDKPREASSSPTPTPKRVYSCRVCGVALASSSNRLRHERTLHKGEAIAARMSLDAPPHTASVAPSASPSASASASRQVSRPPSRAGLAFVSDMDQEAKEDEGEDGELVRFASAASAGAARRVCRQQQHSLPMTSEDEEKSSDGPETPDEASSGSASDTVPPNLAACRATMAFQACIRCSPMMICRRPACPSCSGCCCRR